MPLRILHVSPYSADAWAYGGIPRVVGALTSGLARRGHHVTVCATDVRDATSRLAADRTRTGTAGADIERGVTVRLFRNVSNWAAYRYQAFLPIGFGDYLRRHARDFDVAHLHACWNVPGALAAHYLTRAGVSYVLAPNGTAPIIERRRTAKRAFDAVAGRRVLMGAARVLAVSRAEVEQLTARGVASRTICQVPNPLDLREFDVPLGKRLGTRDADAERRVTFLGKITPRKQVDTLVRAFARLPQGRVRLVIAGNDMGGLTSARALAGALGIADRTEFPGLLRAADRLHALADADLVVYASDHEVFGLVPFEAILAGSPVIVADDSGCGELVRSTGGGVVVPAGSVEALAAAMQEMLDHLPAWKAALPRAASAVRARFGADRVCADLERMYLELASPVERDLSA